MLQLLETSIVDFAVIDFVMASLLMGLGIGADVAVATVTRANQLTNVKMASIWIVGVSFTHTVFPMLGYLLTYFSIQLQPSLEPIVGVIAFGFIFFYLKGELADFFKDNTNNTDRQILVTLGLILAVSWDALWSGPAKSAQVLGWPELFVWMSFIVVGMLVATLAIVSLRVALRVKVSIKSSQNTHWFGHWLQYSIIGYFGLLALFRYTLGLELDWWQVLVISASLVGVCMSQAVEKFRLIELKAN